MVNFNPILESLIEVGCFGVRSTEATGIMQLMGAFGLTVLETIAHEPLITG